METKGGVKVLLHVFLTVALDDLKIKICDTPNVIYSLLTSICGLRDN
jgi:hypothetical protein